VLQTAGVAKPRYVNEQRLAFGRVAELYDRVRPSYPEAVVDAVMDFAALTAPARILEVGAGTGKATVLFAGRGLRLLALEPSRAMAEVARTNCANYPDVEIIESDFELWAADERFPAVISAAAWHWVAPEVRYLKAHRVLLPGGTLAAIWTFPDWESCELTSPLSDAYATAAPTLVPDFPMHPDSQPTSLAGDWMAETTAAGLFTDSSVKTFRWAREYSSVEYASLLQTHQDHILLKDGQRAELLAAITDAIDAHTGIIALPLATRVCLARRA
jgi:SAM-dependent methyltransferase